MRTRAALAAALRAALIPVWAAALLGLSCAAPERDPRAAGGVLDLRGRDPDAAPVALRGEWLFVPGFPAEPGAERLPGAAPRSVPDRWKGGEAGSADGKGSGSYRLVILLPAGARGLGLRWPTVSTAFEAFADGVRVAGAGEPSPDPRLARPSFRPGVAPLPDAADGRLTLDIRVSNHEYREGGLWRDLRIGSLGRLAARRDFRAALALGLACGLASMSVHYLILFVHRRREKPYLYVSLFALLVAFRSLATGEYVLTGLAPGLPFAALIRLEYVTSYLSIPAALLYVSALFPGVARGALRLALALHLPFVLLIPLAPLDLLTRSVDWYYALAWLSLAVAVLPVGAAALRGDPAGKATLAAGLVLAGTAANDLLFSSFLIATGDLVPFGLATFMLLQDLILSRRLAAAFDAVETLGAELERSNALLREEVRGHLGARAGLERLLAEKETHIREIHHRVKNSLQLVSSIAGLQAHRTREAAVAEALDSLRARIRSVSLAHELLYRNDSGGPVDFRAYAEELLGRLAGSFDEPGSPSPRLACESLEVPMELCVDLGLVLNELLTNALKHGGAGKAVEVEARRDGDELLLAVRDGGPGFPPGFDPAAVPTLGFRMIMSLAARRGGRVLVASSGGARVEFRLPLAGQAGKGSRS